MSVLKLTKKDIIRKDDDENKIKLDRSQMSYDSTLVSDWETRNKNAVTVLNQYNERMNSGGFMTADDLTAYRKAMDDYIDSSTGLRRISSIFAGNSAEDDDDKWASAIASMESNYKNASEYYSQWKSEEEYNTFLAGKEEYTDMLNFDIQAGTKEIEGLENLLDEYNALTRKVQTLAPSSPEAISATNRIAELSAQFGNGGKAGIESAISEKKSYMNQAKHIQEGIAMSGVIDNDDFDQYSGYISTRSDDWWSKLTGTEYDATYEYINNQNGFRDEYKDKHSAYSSDNPWSDGESTYEEKGYDYMTEDQIAIYNYYYAKDGKEAAEKYLDSIQETLSYQKGNVMYESMEDKTLLELAFGVAAGLDQFESGIKNLFNTEDDYIPQSAIQIASGMVREDLADAGPTLPDWLGGASLGQVGYDTITTTANMAPSILTSMSIGVINPVAGSITGTALMGASAAGNAYQEALNLGHNKSQARAYSTLVGASEAGLQYLLGGIGKLGGTMSGKAVTKLLNGVDNAIFRTAGKLAGNMLSEGLEEGLQEILTPWFQNLTLHMNEDVNWSEVAYSSLLGALTAGFMEGGTTISGEVNTYRTGKQLQAADISAQRLAEIGKTFSADTVAYQLAGRVNENTGAYTMGRLFNEIGATLSEQNMAEITNALVAKGMDAKTARKNAEALAYVVEGGQLSQKQIAAIEANDVLSEVARTTLIDANTTWNQRTTGYNEALRALAQEVASAKISTNASRTTQTQHGQEVAFSEDNLPPEKNTVPETAYEVSAEGKTIRKDTGDVVSIKGIANIKDGQMTLRLEDGTEVGSKDVAYGSEAEALIHETVAEMGVSAEGANALIRGFEPESGIIASVYANGINEAYQYGRMGAKFADISPNGFAIELNESLRKYAFNLGKMALATQKASEYNKNSTNMEAVNDGTGEGVHLRRGAQRTDGESSGRTVRGVVEGTGTIPNRQEETAGRPGYSGKNHGEAQGQVSAKELGVPHGTEDKNLSYATEDNAELREAKALAEEHGLELVAFKGGNLTVNGADGVFEARAYIYGNKVCVRADHPQFSLMQLLKHEIGHHKIRKGNVDMKKVYDAIVDFASEEYVQHVIESYVAAYASLQGYDADYILEEILCDYEAGMNIFSKERVPDSFWEMSQEVLQSDATKQDTERGPPADGVTRFSRENNKVNTFLRHFTGEVRESEYIWLSNIEKATIKSNIKTGFGHIAPDAKRGIVSAHNRSKGYTYHFVCNADYSVTVIDVLDDVADSVIIDSLQKEVAGNDSTGVRQSGKSTGEEGYGANNRSDDGSAYEKTQPRKSTADVDGGTPDGNRQRDSGPGRENRTNSGTNTTRSTSKLKFAREFVSAQMTEQEKALQKANKQLEKENAKLQEDNQYLKELVKIQKTLTGGTKFTKTSVEAAAKTLKAKANANGDTKALAKLLEDFYGYIAKGDEVTWESVMERARPAVDWLLENEKKSFERDQYAQEVLDFIKGRSFYIDDVQKGEAKYAYGSYQAFRQKLFGTFNISDGARGSLDSFWKELSEEHPYYFPEGVTGGDQVTALVDTVNSLRNAKTLTENSRYEQEMKKQDLLYAVYDSYWNVSTLYSVADVKQREINRLKLAHGKKLTEVRAEHKEQTQKLKEYYQKRMEELREEYRERSEKKQQKIIKEFQESRKKGIDSRHRTAMRHKIKDVVNELNQYLLRGTKERHVPIELQKAVAEALDAVNMDTVGAEERIAKLQEELLKAKTPEQIQEISRKIDHIREMGDRMNDKLQKLKNAYDQFVNSDDPLIANSHDEVISNKLQSVIEMIGDTPLRDMTLSQLEDVYDMYRMVLTTVRNANKAFKAKKSESISVIANQVMMEVEKVGGKKKLAMKGMDGIKSFGWNNLKPVYAFEHIGSDAFTEVFNNVRDGEDIWALDVTEARAFYLDKSKKYNYESWDFKKRHNFTSTSDMDFELTLEQIMSLYAYSKRDQAAEHLRKGGIVIDETTEITVENKLGIPVKFNPTEATAYNISEETLADIISKLTKEQQSFVDEMQDYLSTVMGAKGNEVSLEMYGVKLFKEKFYFPLKSAQQFMAKAKEQAQGEVKIKNSGFSKETVQKASNPIVLTPFMNVWANHVNEMSMYHAFVLPMEDFYRVYNYKTPTSDTMATESVEMFIQNAYGKGATKYIDQLLKDLNGGARTDSTTGIINKMMGLFKKGAVFASLSVVVQQPSAIARAAALVDTKYFIGPKVDHKRHKALWDEVKKYAPVAIIKEMGYFDTNMGKSTQDFILGKEYSSFAEKMKALVTDSGYRDEVLSKAPALADELAWCSLWEAVKRETKDKNPGVDTKSELFLKKCGERFTEVVVKTQVYDSVLSRSGMMRSKDTGMKMATAFMAEPTTSINMIADALLQGKRGNRKYCRATIGAVIASQILNSILVSFVYAGRDDDEDETYAEKYIGTLTGEILDSLNPAGYIPFIKDIMSIVRGYDVERSDMAVISDLWNAWEDLSKDSVSTYRKVEGFAGSIAQIFGLPVKNIMRDARGIYQTINSFVNGQQTTAAGIGYAVKGAITGQTVSNQQQLYEAYLSGDKAQIDRVEGRFKDQPQINSAIRRALRENDPRILEAARAVVNGNPSERARIARKIAAEGHFEIADIQAAINAEIDKLRKETNGK